MNFRTAGQHEIQIIKRTLAHHCTLRRSIQSLRCLTMVPSIHQNSNITIRVPLRGRPRGKQGGRSLYTQVAARLRSYFANNPRLFQLPLLLTEQHCRFKFLDKKGNLYTIVACGKKKTECRRHANIERRTNGHTGACGYYVGTSLGPNAHGRCDFRAYSSREQEMRVQAARESNALNGNNSLQPVEVIQHWRCVIQPSGNRAFYLNIAEDENNNVRPRRHQDRPILLVNTSEEAEAWVREARIPLPRKVKSTNCYICSSFKNQSHI
jgi:hypothetical protein